MDLIGTLKQIHLWVQVFKASLSKTTQTDRERKTNGYMCKHFFIYCKIKISVFKNAKQYNFKVKSYKNVLK